MQPGWLARRYTPKCDVWAVGVILFYFLTLRKPFCNRTSSLFDVIDQVASGNVLPEAQEALDKTGYPAPLRALASKTGLLHPDPAQRTQLEEVLERYPLPEPWDG